MKIEISTLTAELLDTISDPPKVVLMFGNSRVAEWPVPEDEQHYVTGTGGYGHPEEDDIREYLEAFVAAKLSALF